jgi:DNA polymerase-3 subunit gamma/tau
MYNVGMSDPVLYRKYRPKKFSEVLGQETIVKALKGAIQQNAIGHAYLFAGTRGTGKTSLARIFSEQIGTNERDLHEIDAASNRGVDDVRALREEVHTLPFASPYKVYIVDEVHMLTKEAFNALLKTLEEPPKHVVFILATTEIEKLPDTIVSRCQSFTFKKPTTEILKKMILRVAKKEGYTIETPSAELLALLANGSFRDAHGYLQQALSVSTDTTISLEEIEAVTGAPQSKTLLTLLEHIGKNDIDGSLRVVHMLVKNGADMNTTLTLLLRLLRAVLLIRSAPSMRNDIQEEFTEEEFDALTFHATDSKATINSVLLRLLLDAHMRSGTTATPELPLELALIDYLESVS